MKIADVNIAIVYVNLAHREDRRAETEYQLAAQGLRAERQPGIRADRVRDTPGAFRMSGATRAVGQAASLPPRDADGSGCGAAAGG